MEVIYKNHIEIPQLVKKEQIPFFEYPNFRDSNRVIHGFSTRLGGVSQGIFESLNLSFSRGDEKEAVEENYRRVARALGVDLEKMVFSDQTHTTNLRIVDEKDWGKGILRERDYQDIDGLITNVKGTTLVTFYADCVPLFFLDPVKNVITLVHSGWRGTVHKIGKKAVETMEKEFGSNPKDLLCAIGPSICKDCYEVGEEVAEEFRQAFPEQIDSILYRGKQEGKYQLDLWKANEWILMDAGITSEHIEKTHVCTCCNHDLLFSHRWSNGKRGNLAAFLCLKD